MLFNQVNGLPMVLRVEGGFLTFNAPAGFLSVWDYTGDFTIEENGRTYRDTFDPAPYKTPAGVKTFLAPDGSSANDGLTKETPKDDIDDCLAITNCSQIEIAEGVYSRNDTWGTASLTIPRDIAIYKEDGDVRVILGMFTPIVAVVWSKTAGYDNVYETAYNPCEIVVDQDDLDGDGLPAPLKAKASIAEVDAEAGSWYFESAKLYVRLIDDQDPATGDDNQIIAYRNNLLGFEIDVDYNVYLEGLEFWGGLGGAVNYKSTNDYPNSDLIAIDCGFGYADQGIVFYNNNFGYVRGGYSRYCKLDGLGLSSNNTTKPKVLAVDFVSEKHGLSSILGEPQDDHDDNCNAFTGHDGCVLICLNTIGDATDGPIYAFVNEGTTALILGGFAGESLRTTQGDEADACFRGTDGTNVYIKNWEAGASAYSLVKTGLTGEFLNLGGGIDNSLNGTTGTIV